MLFQTLNLPSQALSTLELALKALSDLIVALSCPLTLLISKKPLLLQDFVSFGAPPSLFRHLICLLKPSQALNWLSKPSHALF